MPKRHVNSHQLPDSADEVADALSAVLRDKLVARELAPTHRVESVTMLGRAVFRDLRGPKEHVCQDLQVMRVAPSYGDFDFAISCKSTGAHLGIYGLQGAPVVRCEVGDATAVFRVAFRPHKVVERTITGHVDSPVDIFVFDLACPSAVVVEFL